MKYLSKDTNGYVTMKVSLTSQYEPLRFTNQNVLIQHQNMYNHVALMSAFHVKKLDMIYVAHSRRMPHKSFSCMIIIKKNR